MSKIYVNGIGGSLGADFAIATYLQMSGNVWYVDYNNGVDGAWGKEREEPLKTFAQAYTNAAAGDTICCLANHYETLTASQAMAKAAIYVVGEGEGTSRPRFTNAIAAGGTTFAVTAAGCVFDNIYFPQSTGAAAATAQISLNTTLLEIRDCYFESGAKDAVAALSLLSGAAYVRVSGTTFKSVATDKTAQPGTAIVAAAAVNDMELDEVIFDGGSVGFSSYALNLSGGANLRFKGREVSLLNGADAYLHASTTGVLTLRAKSGSARVEW